MLIIKFHPIETDASSSPVHIPSVTSAILVIVKLKQGSLLDFKLMHQLLYLSLGSECGTYVFGPRGNYNLIMHITWF